MLKKNLLLGSFFIFVLSNFTYANNWTQVNTDGFGDADNIESFSMTIFNGAIYAGITNGVSGCEVRRYNGTTWTQVNTDGFGDANNWEADGLVEYNGNLYVGTTNKNTGCEVWRYNGSAWTRVDPGAPGPGNGGFGDGAFQQDARGMAVFNGKLYVGSENKISGCEVWEYNGISWTQVNMDGFGDANNEECIGMAVYNNYLYVGTERNEDATTGCEVWRTAGAGGSPFADWVQVNTDGFGDENNDIAQYIAVYNNQLYVGTTSLTGGELWRTAAVGDPPFIDWVQVNTDGFGVKDNKTATAMTVYNGNLYVGSGSEITTTGCSVWKTAGAGGPPFTDWVQVITPGFGDTNNLIVLSMVVYNNLLYVGTGNEDSGTEVWKNLANKNMPWISLMLLDD